MSEKRRNNNDDHDDEDDAPKAKRSRRPGPALPTQDSYFAQQMKRYESSAQRELNARFRAIYERPDIMDLLPEAAYLYLEESVHNNLLYSTAVGTVYAFGTTENSVMGTPNEVDTSTPPFVLDFFSYKKIRQVAAGGMHSVALSVDGDVYTWGVGDDGALGRQDTDVGFGKVGGLEKIVQVAAGENFSLALDIDGVVHFTGAYRDSDQKKFGEPINNDCKTRFTPVPIKRMPGKVVQLSASSAGSLCAALLEDGSMVTWGFGNSGELARSADMDALTVAPSAATAKSGGYNLGKEWYWVGDEPSIEIVRERFLRPQPPRWAGAVPFPKKEILSVACGGYHLLVLARDPSGINYVYSSGLNSDGQLGHGDEINRHELTRVKNLAYVNQVAAGGYHSLVLCCNGTNLYGFGRGDAGQLGIGKKSDATGSWFVTEPHHIRFPKQETIESMACGDTHSLAVTIDYKLYTWGFGEMLATGHPTNCAGEADKDIFRPTLLELGGMPLCVAGGGQHSVALVGDKC